ncbi:MAG: phosphoglycerate kinase [Proteobacteria bacterium]|nr:phosphoglycerate kinase [Pseudomonadota bacterium]MBU1595772.1 phosphoglycerate kinase [Pseudomonadota bacterium]
MNVKTMSDQKLKNRRVLIRMDLNAPLDKGLVASDARLRAALPTVRQALDEGAAVILMSHLGRPREGAFDAAHSMRPVARRLAELLGRPIRLEPDWLDGVDVRPGEVCLVENVRFNNGEKANDPELGRRMARLCDVFVMDAFGTAHRAHASTHAVARFAPIACAGPLLTREFRTLGQALRAPARPVTAIVGGSKVSTKLTMLHALLGRVDRLILGGGIANSFLAATGRNVGASLHEPDLLQEARDILREAELAGVDIPLPVDTVCATGLSDQAQARERDAGDVAADEMILDIGPRTSRNYTDILMDSGTILWNGPVGVFECDRFGQGTRAISLAVAESPAYSIAGGGDTLAAIDKYGVAEDISYISTGGGAFMEFMEGKKLPALAALEERAM